MSANVSRSFNGGLFFALIAILAISVSGCTSPPDAVDPLLWPTGTPWPQTLPESAEAGDHAADSEPPFFEGWYHKVSLPARGESFFFIIGRIQTSEDEAAEAFVYCGRAATLDTVYQTFDIESYSSAAGKKDIRIGAAVRATTPRAAGLAVEGGRQCAWDIVYEGAIPWPETMGWASGLPGIETSWSVDTLRAKASGWIRFGDDLIQFDDGIAFSDHNWGKRFPKEWIWLQANAFDDGETALALSGGRVPLGTTTTTAYMIGLYHEGALHTFRTHDRDEIEAEADKTSWVVSALDDAETKRLAVSAACDKASLFHLLVPSEEGMRPHAWESLAGEVEVLFEARESAEDDWGVVFRGTSHHAGVELGE